MVDEKLQLTQAIIELAKSIFSMDYIATHENTFQQDSKPKVRQRRRVRLWTRLSPAHLFRVFLDNHVKGCVTFDNDSEVVAHATAFQVVCDDRGTFSSASHSRHAQDLASAQELLGLSSKFGRQGSVQGAAPEQGSVLAGSVDLAHKHHAVITSCNGLAMADLQGHFCPLRKVGASGMTIVDLQGFSGPVRSRPHGVDAVPESEQSTDTSVSKDALEALFQTSALHPTEFLQSASRRGAAFELAHRLGQLPRGGSGRMRRPRSRSISSASVSPIAMSTRPLTPVTDMSTFREQSRRRKPYDTAARASSRRSLSRPASRLAVKRPNPHRDYDTKAPSPTATSP